MANKVINWTKRGYFNQVINYRVYGDISDNPRCSFAPVITTFGKEYKACPIYSHLTFPFISGPRANMKKNAKNMKVK